MAEVSPINTNDLLTNIQNRYNKDEIFTNVGETLIIVNPYQIIPGLYTQEKMDEIINLCNENSIDKFIRGHPHCFDTTMHTIYDLIHIGKNQALVISGESGAGKTECAKLCMKFIAYYFGNKNEKKEISLEDKILACNPVLEAFGNAKTVRNDNSSRFGKYIKIFININTKQIVGAFMETYLLEKSRVCSLATGERNYHVFYQIVLGINLIIKEKFNYDNVFKKIEDMGLKLQDNSKKYIRDNLNETNIKNFMNLNELKEVKLEDFNYLKSDVYAIDRINDVFNFYEMIEGMVNTNFKDEEINLVIQLTMGILFCGNIDFIEEPSKDKCHISDKGKKIQEKVSQMLNIDMNIFSDCFLYNVRIIKGETIKSDLKLNDCIAFRDTFSKEMYNRLFNYLVKKMNTTLFDETKRESIENDPEVKHIGLLDIFGFECFKENSFEQFCINYANEKLQNLYVEDIFKEIENMFIREGLKDHFKKIEFRDNMPILDAMGKFPTGIFYQLDNECNVGQKDMNLLSKIFSTLKNNPSVKSSLKFKEKFIIIHTAKDVEYTIINFCTKNLDEFKIRMKDSVNSIKDNLIKSVIGEEDESTKGKKEKYLGGKFRSDMDNLAHALRQCVRHYIRCLKPNELKKKNYFVPFFSLQQIKYMGVLDTIKIRQEGFPVIKTKLEYYLRYEDACDFQGKLFYKDVKEDNPQITDWCKNMTNMLIPNYSEDFILFGKTVILMKQKFCDDMDNARRKALEIKQKQVTKITNYYRGIQPRKVFRDFYKAIYTLEQNYKLFAYINRMNKIREVTKILQTKSRMLTVKNNSVLFKEKIERLKRFFYVSNIKIQSKKTYIKILQTKYIITNYVSSFKHQKYLKYRKLVKNILEKRIEKYIESTLIPSIIFLQKHFRSYMTKVNMGEIYENIKNRRKILKEEIQCKKIQKHFKKHYFMNVILIKQKAVDKFIGLFKIKKFRTWYLNIREKVRTIQGAYKRRYLMKHIIETRLREFTEEQENKFEEANYISSANLFPESQIDNNLNESQSTLKTENQRFYDKKLKNLNPSILTEISYLNHSPYEEPKLNFFAHILDLDSIINLDEIYENPWSETYQEIIKHNINQNTPIQLIEVGEFYTCLINSNGKTFTWGWNGNGNCSFNMNKDNNYLFDDFEPVKEKKNICFKDIDSTFSSELDENFDFDSEIENIKEEKNIFGDDDDDNFSLDKFKSFYYINSPMIIDNYNIRKIKCGDDNTMILTKDNKLYVFGANNNYQLGILKKRNIYTPTLVNNIIKENPSNINLKSNIIDMSSSGKNNILLTEKGTIILLSSNILNGENSLNKTPYEISIPDIKFSNIECGKDFCLLLSTNGYLYSFGNNKYGQLGHGDFIDRNYPTLIKYFVDNKIKVQQISTGYKHSACKGNNKAYSWGCNTNCQLGTNNLKNMNIPFLNDIKFSKMKNNILQVSCGFRSTVFLTETRQIFWCGTNGDIQQQDYPIEFFYQNKIPELFSFDNHQIVKINHTYSKSMSILYATVAETGNLKLKLNNPNKLNMMLNNLTVNWNMKDIYPSNIDNIENFIAEKHINKVRKGNKGRKK